MKIRRLYIDGFGPFAGREFDGLSPGLNVFSGPNEAGKSALRAFMRAVLFGFVTGRASTEERSMYEYPALAGGVHGGLIEFAAEDGAVFTVERYRRDRGPVAGEIQVVCDGATGGQEMLNDLFHPVDARVYQNVYSISLEELGGLDSEVQERIAAAGLGATGDVSGVSRRIDTELTSLRRELKAAQTGHRDERREYQAAQIEMDGYRTLVEKRQGIGRAVESAREEMRRARERLTRLDMLADSRKNWNRMQEMQRQMEGLPRLEFLPPQPLVCLDEALRSCRDVEKLIQEGDQQGEHRQQELKSVAPDLAPELCTDVVSRLITRQSEYENAVEDIEEVRARADENEQRLQNGLSELGSGWEAATLELFDDSLATRSAVEQLEETLTQGRRRLDASELETRQAQTDRNASAQASEDAERRLAALGAPPEMTLETLTAQRSALNRLRALAAERPDAQRGLDDAAYRLASAEGRRRSRLAMSVQLGVSAAVAAAGVVTSIMSIKMGEPKVAQLGYVVAGVGGLGVVTSLALLLWPFRRRRFGKEASGEPDDAART